MGRSASSPPTPDVARHLRIIGLVVRHFHAHGVKLCRRHMQGGAIEREKHECAGQPRPLVAVTKSLRSSKPHQVGGGEIGQVGTLVVVPTMDRAREGGDHDVDVDNSVRSTKPLNLLRVQRQQCRVPRSSGVPAEAFARSLRQRTEHAVVLRHDLRMGLECLSRFRRVRDHPEPAQAILNPLDLLPCRQSQAPPQSPRIGVYGA